MSLIAFIVEDISSSCPIGGCGVPLHFLSLLFVTYSHTKSFIVIFRVLMHYSKRVVLLVITVLGSAVNAIVYSILIIE